MSDLSILGRIESAHALEFDIGVEAVARAFVPALQVCVVNFQKNPKPRKP